MSEKWVHGRKPGANSARGDWKHGIFLTVNGGTGRLLNATIPIEWKFSPALAAEEPQYVVVVDHEFSIAELERRINQNYACAKRHDPIPVTEFAKYLQLRKSGHHHIIVVVFCGTPKRARENAQAFVSGDPDSYRHTITVDQIKNGHLGGKWNAYLYTFPIDVPDELLSHAPTKGWEKFVWDWSNRWHDRRPVDDCDFRKRRLKAFTVQPLPFLIGRLCYGLFMTLYNLLGMLLLAFFGWKPINPFKNILWSWINYPRSKMNILMNTKWRDWSTEDAPQAHIVPIWYLPVFYTSLFFAGRGLRRFWQLHPQGVLTVIGILICAGVLIGCMLAIEAFAKSTTAKSLRKRSASFLKRSYRNFREHQKMSKEDRVQKKREKHLARLSTITTVGGSTTLASVDIGAVIRRANPLAGAKLIFWAVKSKSCKPYAH
jgi:putative Mn2+ efflux pump MntP